MQSRLEQSFKVDALKVRPKPSTNKAKEALNKTY